MIADLYGELLPTIVADFVCVSCAVLGGFECLLGWTIAIYACRLCLSAPTEEIRI